MSDIELRKEPPGRDAVRPIGGAAAMYRSATATLVVVGQGRVEYGEEQPVSVWPHRWFELPVADRTLYWSGVEVKTAGPQWKDHWIVAALECPPTVWFAHAPLRRAYKRADKDEKIRAELERSGSLRALGFDPFETDGRWRTARLDDPRRLHWENGTVLGNGFVRGQGPPPDVRPVWYFGLCTPQALELALGKHPDDGEPTRPERSGYVVLPATTVGMTSRTAAIWRALAGRADGDRQTFHERAESQ